MKADTSKEKKGKSWTPKLRRKITQPNEKEDLKLRILFRRDRGCYGFAVQGDNPVAVDRILEGSPAWNAGLRSDDLILRIHGNKVEKCSMSAVVSIIQNTADELDLVVIRRRKKPDAARTLSSFKSYIDDEPSIHSTLDKRKSLSLSELDKKEFQQFLHGRLDSETESGYLDTETENEEDRTLPDDFDALSPLETKRQLAIRDLLRCEEAFLSKFDTMLKDARAFSCHLTDEDAFGKMFLMMEVILRQVHSSFGSIVSDIRSIQSTFPRMSSNPDHPRTYVECIGLCHQRQIAKIMEYMYDIPVDNPTTEEGGKFKKKVPFYDLLRVIIADIEECIEENFIILQSCLADVQSCTPRKHPDFKPLRTVLGELRKINQGRLENSQVRRRKDSLEIPSGTLLRRLSWDSNSRNLLRRSSLTFDRHSTLEKAVAAAGATPPHNGHRSPSSPRRSTLATVPLPSSPPEQQRSPGSRKTSTGSDTRIWSLRRDHTLTRSLPRRLIPFKDRHSAPALDTPRQKKTSVTSLLKKPFTRHTRSTEEGVAKTKKPLGKTLSVPATVAADHEQKMGKKDFTLGEHAEIASPLAKRLPIFRKRQKSDNCELKSMSLSNENLQHRSASRVNSNNSDGSGPFSDASSIASDDEWHVERGIEDYRPCEETNCRTSFQRQRSLTCPHNFDHSLDVARAMRNESSIGHLASPLSSRSLPRISDRRRKKPLHLLGEKSASLKSKSSHRAPGGGIYCGDDSVLEVSSPRISPRGSPRSSVDQMHPKKTPPSSSPSSPLRILQHFQGTVKGLLGKDDDSTDDQTTDAATVDRLSPGYSTSSSSSDDRRSLHHSLSHTHDVSRSNADVHDGITTLNGESFCENHFKQPESDDAPKQSNLTSRRHTVSATDNAVLEARKILNKKSRPGKHEVMEWGNCFETLLADTRGIELFRMFLRSEFSEENILFWLACEDLKQTRSFKVPAKAKRIYKTYIEPQSPQELNLDHDTKMAVTEGMMSPSRSTFEQAQLRIRCLMSKDSYPRFLKSPIYIELIDS